MEEWKLIVGFDGKYQVSSLGRVRSTKYNEPKILTPYKHKQGYVIVDLWQKGTSRGKKLLVHRLVALAFLPNPEGKAEVNHLNGVKDDNRIENIEWSTRTENNVHALRTGLRSGLKGRVSERRKLSKDQVLSILSLFKNNGTTKLELATLFGVSDSTIGRVINGQHYLNF